MTLPPEIWFLVFIHCDVQTAVSLGQVSSMLHEIWRSESLDAVLEAAVTRECPFLGLADVFEGTSGWSKCAHVLSKRMANHQMTLNEFVDKAASSSEYSYLADLNALKTVGYAAGMQKLISADESSFTRQMMLKKAKQRLESIMGVRAGEEVKYFDNGVEVVVQKGSTVLVVVWKGLSLDFDSVWSVDFNDNVQTTVAQLTNHTLVVRSQDSTHGYFLLRDQQPQFLFSLCSPARPPVFDYNGYLWLIVHHQLFPVLTTFTSSGCKSFVSSWKPICVPEKPFASTFCTMAESPFRHRNGTCQFRRYLLLSENPFTSCDFFVDLETGTKYASSPLEAHDKVYPIMDGPRLCFVKRN
ncbi:hypothetical protein CJU89_6504 [Yarrowia sp. B02]|nr:hypothetical protein CJU89_6504 [Yarrowia sp. B02]